MNTPATSVAVVIDGVDIKAGSSPKRSQSRGREAPPAAANAPGGPPPPPTFSDADSLTDPLAVSADPRARRVSVWL